MNKLTVYMTFSFLNLNANLEEKSAYEVNWLENEVNTFSMVNSIKRKKYIYMHSSSTVYILAACPQLEASSEAC